MRSNFVVSADRRFWVEGVKNLFAVDPYIVHVLKSAGRHSEYENIQVAPLRRTSREDFQADHEFVDQKFHKYTDILTRRLDYIHATQHGDVFWKKALALSLLRHISLCYDVFQACELHFVIKEHDCRLLDVDSYHVPLNFEDHRHVYQNTNFGQEQLFSIYCGLFYPGRFSSIKLGMPLPAKPARVSFIKRVFRGGLVSKLFRRLIERLLVIRQPSVGILESYFAPKHLNRLMLKSWGGIQRIELPKIRPGKSEIRHDLRDQLTCGESDFDRFDQFVFATLRYAMPQSFVENFAKLYSGYQAWSARYTRLTWVVDEAWIGHEPSAWALATLRQRGVKHICNEHNYLSHPFLGNSLKYQIPLTDEFVTLGWEDQSYPNLVRGASLFEWVEGNASVEKEHDLLLVLGCPIFHPPEINAAYGDCGGFGASSYFEMSRRFLASLGSDALSKVYVRAYPAWKVSNLPMWDHQFALAPYMDKIKAYDNQSVSARVLMQKSRLVIVNYLSTSYLESIISDIPTVFLWNRNSNMFIDKHVGIFDCLIEAGVCQVEPEIGADFVLSIKDDPEAWWSSPPVRSARQNFLEKNIGDPSFMMNYLLAKLDRGRS